MKRPMLVFTIPFLLVIFILAQANLLGDKTDMTRFDGMEISCTATVEDFSQKADNSICYTVLIKQSPFEKLLNKKVMFYADTENVFNYHDTIKIEGTCRLPKSTGGFDALAYYGERGVLLTLNTSKITTVSTAEKSLMVAIKNISLNLRNKTDKLLKAPYAGLMRAILLGDTSDIDPFAMYYIQKSGIVHAFSVSGMHISILSEVLLLLLSLFPLSLRTRHTIAIVGVWVLVMITGMGIPACRAGVMTTVFLSAAFFKRQSDAITSLSFSACLLLLINPIAIKSASFLMTFAATAGVLTLPRVLSAAVINRFSLYKKGIFHKGIRGIIKAVSPSFAATIATFPITVIFFGGLSIVSPITNLLLLPILPILLCLGILLLLISYIPFLSPLIPIVTAIIETCFAFMLFICKKLSGLKFSYLGLDFKFVLVWVFVFAALLLGFFFLRKIFDKFRQFQLFRLSRLVVCSFSLLIFCGAFNSYLTRDKIFIEAFSSSRGASVAVTQGRSAVVISIADDKQSDKNVLTFLQNKNINSLDSYIELNGKVGRIQNSIAHRDRDLLFSVYPPKYVFPSQRYPFKLNEGYKINDVLTAFMIESGKGVLLKINNQKILFTADFAVAQEIKSDILYFCGDDKQVILKNNADKIIFLSGELNDSQKMYG